jgi:hypothetical protein
VKNPIPILVVISVSMFRDEYIDDDEIVPDSYLKAAEALPTSAASF